MSKFETLPIILVSAKNETIASEILKELIDNDVSDQYPECEASPDRVWRLVNKYYTADVKVRGVGDESPADARPDPSQVDAHVVYIDETEMAEDRQGALTAIARGNRAGWADAHIRVIACHGTSSPLYLEDEAAAARAELVPRNEPAQPDDDAAQPFAEERGLARARAALHAHAWRGLSRLDRPKPAENGWSASDDSSSSAGEESEGEELAVERAEEFALALGALGAAPPDARRDNAEELVAAFCRALGLTPPN